MTQFNDQESFQHSYCYVTEAWHLLILWNWNPIHIKQQIPLSFPMKAIFYLNSILNLEDSISTTFKKDFRGMEVKN